MVSFLTPHRRNRRVSGTSRESQNGGFFTPGHWWRSINWDNVRMGVVGVVFALVWLLLWAKAAWVQLMDGPWLAERARRQHVAAEVEEIPRGMITDRNGTPLARSVECRSVYANPSEVTDKEATAAALASILHLPQNRLLGALDRNSRFIWIARRVDDATAQAIRQAALPGIELAREFERIYPYKQVAGQLLGFVGIDGNGLEGVERAFDDVLASAKARRLVQRDALGRRFQLPDSLPVPESDTLRLTLDLQVQFIAEDALAHTVESVRAKWGGVILVDTRNGDVLAWAQYPSFNPNLYKDTPPSLYRNRLALDALEPGSTFKPFTIATAIQEKLITRDTIFDCEHGVWRTKHITIRDDRQSLGELPVHEILSRSSNIGSAKIGFLIGAPKFHQYLWNLGFGQRTGLQIADSRGILRKPRDWSETDLYSTSFGQSISVTAAQMAQAYLTLANGGVAKPLNIAMDENRREPDGAPRRIYSASTAREVLSLMKEVVDSGTGRRAAIPGLSIAGKTGTAQKADKSGKYGQGRVASFVGLVPAEKPKYLCVVILDEPADIKYGGAIAAPLFREVLSRTMAYYGELPQQNKPAEDMTRRAVAEASGFEAAPRQAGPSEVRQELKDTKNTQHSAASPKGGFPDVTGRSVRQAMEVLTRKGVVPQFRGNGTVVVRQTPQAGSPLPSADGNGKPLECTLWLSEKK